MELEWYVILSGCVIIFCVLKLTDFGDDSLEIKHKGFLCAVYSIVLATVGICLIAHYAYMGAFLYEDLARGYILGLTGLFFLYVWLLKYILSKYFLIWVIFAFGIYFIMLTACFGWYYLIQELEEVTAYSNIYHKALTYENSYRKFFECVMVSFKVALPYYIDPLQNCKLLPSQRMFWIIFGLTVLPAIFKPTQDFFSNSQKKQEERESLNRENEKKEREPMADVTFKETIDINNSYVKPRPASGILNSRKPRSLDDDISELLKEFDRAESINRQKKAGSNSKKQ